ncbi:MAG: RNA polymerase sigma factor [Woeseiaceae bacterium]
MPHSEAGITARRAKEGDELALLGRVRRGDRGAFSRLYQLYHPRLYGYLRRLLPDPGTVEEVVDDVMLVVWKDAGKFRGGAALSSWIFGIAYRKAMTAMRAERRYQAPLDRSLDAETVSAASSQHDEWIRAALMRLSPDHRQVVELTYFSGFSYQEIADIAGCPVNTVKTRMFHARRRLRVLLPVLAGQAKEQDRGTA